MEIFDTIISDRLNRYGISLDYQLQYHLMILYLVEIKCTRRSKFPKWIKSDADGVVCVLLVVAHAYALYTMCMCAYNFIRQITTLNHVIIELRNHPMGYQATKYNLYLAALLAIVH